jgi:DNA polymerase-3 subunit delta
MSQPVYLVVGESFLAEEVLDRIRAEESTDPLSEAEFDAKAETAAVIEALTTSSLLGGRRLVIVREADSLVKETAEALTAYLEQPSADSILVLIASGRTKLDPIAKKIGAVVGLDPPKGRRLASWVRERGRSHGLKIDDRAAWALIDSVGSDLRELDGALEQLSTSLGKDARIGPAEVRAAFPRLADERIYVFTDAIGERKLPVAMVALRRLLDQGEEPLVIFGALAAHIRRLLRIRRQVGSGPRAVADALGMPEWRAERMLRQARAYKEEELIDAMETLAGADVDIKGEFPSPEGALERAVVRIVAAAKPS